MKYKKILSLVLGFGLIFVWLSVISINKVEAISFNSPTGFHTRSAYGAAVGDYNGDGIDDLAVVQGVANNLIIFIGKGNGDFEQNAFSASVAGGPDFVSSGDLNGDGFLDLVTSDYGSTNVMVFIGKGDGTFDSAVRYNTGTTPLDVEIADFNGDTFLDLAVSNNSTNNISILLGVGDGTFRTAVNYATGGTGVKEIISGKFNADTYLDLAIVNQTTNNISILLGVGDGTFGTAVTYAVGTSPRYIRSGYFNSDAFLDLAIANYTTKNISVLLGVGDGTFSAAVNYSTGMGSEYPKTVEVGDFNNDGKSDLATLNYVSSSSPSTLSILLGTGSGTFGAATNYRSGMGTTKSVISDFNNDGNLDLISLNYSARNFSVFLGKGDGTFDVFQNYAVGTGPRYVATGNFNNDSHLDLAVANFSSNNISILLGTGSGTFGTATNYNVGTGPSFIVTGDFNRDNIVDLAVTNNTTNNVSILLGLGDGKFGTATNYNVGTGPLGISTKLLNEDAFLDLIVVNNLTNNVSVLLGVGDGTFGSATNYAVGTGPTGLSLGYFNNDNFFDLAVANYGSNNISVLLGGSNGTFGTTTNYSMTGAWDVKIGDLNGDSFLDLFSTNFNTNGYAVLLGTGDGTFGSATNSFDAYGPAVTELVDFNGDGNLDAIMADYFGSVIAMGNGDGTFDQAIDYSALGKDNPAVATGDFDEDGKLDFVNTNLGWNNISVFLQTKETPAVYSLGSIDYLYGEEISDTTPSLTFNLASSIDVKYEIQIDNNSDFSSPVVDYVSTLETDGNKTFTVGQAAGNGTYIVGQESQVLDAGNYYWQVKAINEENTESPYTTARSGGIAFTIPDTTPPVITLIGPSSVTVNINSVYNDQGATASDNLNADLTSSIITVNNVDTATAGIYTVTYNVEDAAGNQATEVTRNVEVKKIKSSSDSHYSGYVVPKIPPTITEVPPTITPPVVTQPASSKNPQSLIPNITHILKLKFQGNEVKALQIYLNTHGFPVSVTGSGSLGNETNYFGPKTKAAVILFQKANKLNPDGIVGPLTRAQIK